LPPADTLQYTTKQVCRPNGT